MSNECCGMCLIYSNENNQMAFRRCNSVLNFVSVGNSYDARRTVSGASKIARHCVPAITTAAPRSWRRFCCEHRRYTNRQKCALEFQYVLYTRHTYAHIIVVVAAVLSSSSQYCSHRRQRCSSLVVASQTRINLITFFFLSSNSCG